MAKRTSGTFTRRGPDALTEELAAVLLESGRSEFKPLFAIVYANLRARNLASGGEEMFRLRAYEKLHDLVRRGMVDKVTTNGIKEYSGLGTLSAVLRPDPIMVVPGAVV